MGNTMKYKWLVSVIVLLVVYVFASPYLVVYQIRAATQSHDAPALAKHIDFISVRTNLKDQLNQKIAGITSQAGDDQRPFSRFGTALAGLMVDKLVDVYVTPSGMQQLMSGKKPQSPSTAPQKTPSNTPTTHTEKPDVTSSMSYQSLNTFVVSATGKTGDLVDVVLSRQGLTWKVTNIVLPLDQHD